MQYDPKQGIDPATVAALNAAEDRKDAVKAGEKRLDRIDNAHYEAWTKTAPSVELGPGAEDGPFDMKRARPYERVLSGPRDPQQSTGTLFNSTQDREAVKKASQDPLQDFLDRRKPVESVERDPRQGELLPDRQPVIGENDDRKQMGLLLSKVGGHLRMENQKGERLSFPGRNDDRPAERLLTKPITRKNTMGGM